MKNILLISAACLFITSILFSQSREDSIEDYLSELNMPDSILKKLPKPNADNDSLFSGKFWDDSLRIYANPEYEIYSNNGLYRIYNMPEYRLRREYFPKMPEYNADSSIVYNMPEAKFPGLIRDKNKMLKQMKKYKREK